MNAFLILQPHLRVVRRGQLWEAMATSDQEQGAKEGLDKWLEEFEAFQARFAPYFRRREPREQAPKYVRGLCAGVDRKNSWQLAEAVGDADPQPMQRLMYSAQWDENKATGPTAGRHTYDRLEFVARVVDHIPDKGQVLQRYFHEKACQVWGRLGGPRFFESPVPIGQP